MVSKHWVIGLKFTVGILVTFHRNHTRQKCELISLLNMFEVT